MRRDSDSRKLTDNPTPIMVHTMANATSFHGTGSCSAIIEVKNRTNPGTTPGPHQRLQQ